MAMLVEAKTLGKRWIWIDKKGYVLKNSRDLLAAYYDGALPAINLLVREDWTLKKKQP